jgi:CRP-like cAMP-binding protein
VGRRGGEDALAEVGNELRLDRALRITRFDPPPDEGAHPLGDRRVRLLEQRAARRAHDLALELGERWPVFARRRRSTAAALFRSLMSALRVRQEAARYYGSVRHVDRVRAKLLQLGRQFGRVTPIGIRVEFPLTHHLLADMIASARETVTRCLDQLHRDGFLVRDGHSYTPLLSPEALDASD